jgi:hypothetical protein
MSHSDSQTKENVRPIAHVAPLTSVNKTEQRKSGEQSKEEIEQALADLSDQRVRWIEQVAYSAGVPAPSGTRLQPVATSCSALQPVAASCNPSRARAGADQTRPEQTKSNHHQTRPSEGGGGGGDSAGSQGGTDSADQARRVGVVGVMNRLGCTPKQVAQVIEMCGPVKPLVLETEDARRIAGQIEKDKTVRNQAMQSAAVDTGGSGETTRKVYRRADLIRLKMTDPARYESMNDEILQAYSEGRVK